VNVKNLIFLVGRLVADPELSYTPQGTPVSNFAVAVNRSTPKRGGGWEDSLDGYFDCELFGGAALTLAEDFHKGDEIQLMGSLRQKRWTTKGEQPRKASKIEIRVESIASVLELRRLDDAKTDQQQPEPQPA
jgi:single-strand DNA-binding protein